MQIQGDKKRQAFVQGGARLAVYSPDQDLPAESSPCPLGLTIFAI